MPLEFDRETIERYRSLPADEAFEQVRSAVYRTGSVGSEDFLEAYEQLVREGVLTWEQIESFDR